MTRIVCTYQHLSLESVIMSWIGQATWRECLEKKHSTWNSESPRYFITKIFYKDNDLQMYEDMLFISCSKDEPKLPSSRTIVATTRMSETLMAPSELGLSCWNRTSFHASQDIGRSCPGGMKLDAWLGVRASYGKIFYLKARKRSAGADVKISLNLAIENNTETLLPTFSSLYYWWGSYHVQVLPCAGVPMFLKKIPMIGGLLRKMSIRAIKRLMEDINQALDQAGWLALDMFALAGMHKLLDIITRWSFITHRWKRGTKMGNLFKRSLAIPRPRLRLPWAAFPSMWKTVSL